jgi:type I restriction enzyme S subunit
LRLPIPEPQEQGSIAAFLDEKCAKIDEAVKLEEEQIKLLRERRQILIQQAVTRGLNPAAPMKDSGIDWIGQIPAHWEVKPCRYAFRSVKRFDRNGSEIKLSVTQRRGIVPTDGMEESSTQASNFDEFQICYPNDLVLNKYKAHLGVFWMTPYRGIITNNYTVFRPLIGVVAKYFEVLFHTPSYISMFRTTVYGVTEGMMPLYTGDFYGLPAICPPEDEQNQVLEHLRVHSEKFDTAISLKESQISTLKEYKTTLINAAVTGKIKVC